MPAEVEAVTIAERGWCGKRNGALLRKPATELDIGIILLRAPSNRLLDLLPLVPGLHEALKTIQLGQHFRVTT